MSFYENPPDGPYQSVPVPPPAPQPKKSGKTLWIVFGSVAVVVLLVCFGIGFLAILADDGSPGSGSKDSGSDSDGGGKEEAKAAAIGDTVSDGGFEFTVSEVEDGVEKVGDEYLSEEASGEFVIVHVTVKNTGDKAELFSDTEQKLLDTEGKQYDADSEAGIYIEGNDALLENINPGNKADVQLVFDVPKDTKLDSVVLSGSFGSEGVQVKLGD